MCIEEAPVHQQEMMKACANGEVSKLQRLLQDAGVSRGAMPTQRNEDVIHVSGPPATSTMLHTAVSHHQPEILQVLLEIYPSVKVSRDTLLGSEFANPDLPTLKVLHSHDSSIVNLELDERGLDTLLDDYCGHDSPHRAEYLLDHGANANGSGPPSVSNPLLVAMMSGQPPALVNKLIECGARVRPLEVTHAIRYQRGDILNILFNQCRWDLYDSKRANMAKAMQDAYDTGNKEIILLIREYIENEKVKNEKTKSKKAKRTWWKFGS